MGGGALSVMAIYETMSRMKIPEDQQLGMLDLIQRVNNSVQKAVNKK